MTMTNYVSPGWLRERNNDGYGTPNKHPFWGSVDFEQVGTFKVFESDGWAFAYDGAHNAWYHFDTKANALSHIQEFGSVDVWA